MVKCLRLPSASASRGACCAGSAGAEQTLPATMAQSPLLEAQQKVRHAHFMGRCHHRAPSRMFTCFQQFHVAPAGRGQYTQTTRAGTYRLLSTPMQDQAPWTPQFVSSFVEHSAWAFPFVHGQDCRASFRHPNSSLACPSSSATRKHPKPREATFHLTLFTTTHLK